jgi:hypothetical protein
LLNTVQGLHSRSLLLLQLQLLQRFKLGSASVPSYRTN